MQNSFALDFLCVTAATTSVVIILIVFGTRSAGVQADTASAQETRRLYFASCVVTGLGYIFITGMLMSYFGTEKGVALFDGVKTIIPPIITLILGYYFGATKPIARSKGKANEGKPPQ
jgi:hypothetical protein